MAAAQGWPLLEVLVSHHLAGADPPADPAEPDWGPLLEAMRQPEADPLAAELHRQARQVVCWRHLAELSRPGPLVLLTGV